MCCTLFFFFGSQVPFSRFYLVIQRTKITLSACCLTTARYILGVLPNHKSRRKEVRHSIANKKASSSMCTASKQSLFFCWPMLKRILLTCRLERCRRGKSPVMLKKGRYATPVQLFFPVSPPPLIGVLRFLSEKSIELLLKSGRQRGATLKG